MNIQPYQYVVVRYVHNPAVGECLNVGVILCCRNANLMDAKFDSSYGRLSKAFARFEGEHYRRFVNRLSLSVERLADKLRAQELFPEAYSFEAVLQNLMPDAGMSFQLGEVLAGITHDPASELEQIFARFVSSQYEREQSPIRDDEAVWNVFRQPLKHEEILERLQPKTFRAEDLEYSFERAFKNGRWHVLESASFDYIRPESLKNKATQYLGIGTALANNPEMGKLYLLLGRPTRKNHIKQYESAKRLLSDHLQVEHELVEENEADKFAKDVAAFMKGHPAK